MNTETILGILIPFIGTSLGAAMVFERNRFAIACGCAIMKIHAFAFFDYCV
jgi:hypothetical protein